MREEFVEKILTALAKECGKKLCLDVFVLTEVEGDSFKVLFCLRKGDKFGVVKSSGKLKLFHSISLLQQYKRELEQRMKEEIEREKKETVAVFETSTTLCLN